MPGVIWPRPLREMALKQNILVLLCKDATGFSLVCSAPWLDLPKLDICGWTDVLFRLNSVEPIISSGYSGDFPLFPCVPPILKRDD